MRPRQTSKALSELPDASFAERIALVKKLGVIEVDRTGSGRERFRLLFKIAGERIRVTGWPNPDPTAKPIRFKDRASAEDALAAIRSQIQSSGRKTLRSVLSGWVSRSNPEDLVVHRVEE